MARARQAAAAGTAIFARLERQADPAGSLAPEERAALVRSASRRLSAGGSAVDMPAERRPGTQTPIRFIAGRSKLKKCFRHSTQEALSFIANTESGGDRH